MNERAKAALPLSEAFGVKPTDGGLSDDAISLPDTAEREGRLWIRHAEKTASPYLRFDQWAVTMIPLPAGKRRWTMGPSASAAVSHGEGRSHIDPRRSALGLSRSPAWKSSCRFHHRSFRDRSDGDVTPKREHQLARQGDNGNAPDPPLASPTRRRNQ